MAVYIGSLDPERIRKQADTIGYVNNLSKLIELGEVKSSNDILLEKKRLDIALKKGDIEYKAAEVELAGAEASVEISRKIAEKIGDLNFGSNVSAALDKAVETTRAKMPMEKRASKSDEELRKWFLVEFRLAFKPLLPIKEEQEEWLDDIVYSLRERV